MSLYNESKARDLDRMYLDFARLQSVELLSKMLIEYVIKEYNIKGYSDFTCPHHKRLAMALGIFGNVKPEDR